MNTTSRLFQTFKLLCAILAVSGAMSSAQAAPVIGASLYYAGGDITVTVQPASAGYVSELGIFDASRNQLIDLDLFNYQVGTSVLVSAATMASKGFIAGAEVIFGIYVTNTGDTFVMGDGSRNADGLAHAAVDALGGGDYSVGFEDLYGGGDLDYDDNVFLMIGGLIPTPNPTPIPGTLVLIGMGLVALGARRRAAHA